MMDAENILSEITVILKQYGIEKIILFGSYAYEMGDLFYKEIYSKGKIIYA